MSGFHFKDLLFRNLMVGRIVKKASAKEAGEHFMKLLKEHQESLSPDSVWKEVSF